MADEDDNEDPYVTRLKECGCYEQHILLQDCYFEKKDFRRCSKEMEQFKACWAKTHQADKTQ